MGRLSEDEIRRLAEEARRGSHTAFDDLVRDLHRQLLGRIGGALWSAADPQRAEEAAQQVWIDVWEDIRKSAAEGGFDPARGVPFYVYICKRFADFRVRQANHPRGREVPWPQGPDDEPGRELPLEDTRQAPPPDVLERKRLLEIRLAAYCELFRLTFLCGGYPHQQFALGFSKLIFGSLSRRAIEGSPKAVDERHGATPFERLLGEFWEAYRSASGIADPRVRLGLRKHLAPVEARLPLAVGELMRLDPASLSQFARLSETSVGRTSLRDHYADRKGGFTAAIPDWCDKVERRVRHVLGASEDASPESVFGPLVEAAERRASVASAGKPDACPPASQGLVQPVGCSRCKLRHAPPCVLGGRSSC